MIQSANKVINDLDFEVDVDGIDEYVEQKILKPNYSQDLFARVLNII